MEKIKISSPYLEVKVDVNRMSKNEHSSLIPQMFKFSFTLNWEESKGIEFRLMMKLPKYPYLFGDLF